MENTIKFSVWFPLSVRKYVGLLLSTLCKQNFKDFEVIVVDAKSLDKTQEVVEKFKDRLDLKFVTSPQKEFPFKEITVELSNMIT
jgi:glycosyltransferase involved in cell wall biosynthesis